MTPRPSFLTSSGAAGGSGEKDRRLRGLPAGETLLSSLPEHLQTQVGVQQNSTYKGEYRCSSFTANVLYCENIASNLAFDFFPLLPSIYTGFGTRDSRLLLTISGNNADKP